MNNKSYRILVNNQDSKDNQISVKLDQHYDQLDVLSLTLTQEDVYTNKCSDWGVVVGRVTANNGVGVPNAKVSIFIPLQPEDESRPEITNKYPFKQISDKRNGVRYNLLPSVKQSKEHTPVGTFPTKEEVLKDSTWIEVYQKYYKYTTRTNNAGDYMFYGVPVGSYTLHFDVDISDIGELSVLPFELIAQGRAPEEFASPYKYKSSIDIDSLPQIITKDKTIQVQPFWGSEDLCDVSLLRSDFDLTEQGVEIKSYCLFIGSVISDTGGNSVNKNCGVNKKIGRHNQLTSGPGFIQILHVVDSDGDNIPDRVEFKDDPNAVIDENGAFAFLLELTGQKVITDEFGNETISPDGTSGVIKNGFYRFKLGLGFESDARIRNTANYIVPNNGKHQYAYLFNRNDVTYYDSTTGDALGPIPGFNTLSENSGSELDWSVDGDNEFNGGPLFKKLERKKVYTVRNYIPRYSKKLGGSTPRTEKFLGLKNNAEDGGKNPVPYNRINSGVSFWSTLLCALNDVIFFLVATINKTVLFALNIILGTLSNIINGILSAYCGLIQAINNALCPLDISIDLGVLGTYGFEWNIWCPNLPPVCSTGGVAWGIPYISYACCKTCPPESNCNCYIPWYTNCYPGDYCDDTNTNLRRSRQNTGGDCNTRSTFQQARHLQQFPSPPTTGDLDDQEITLRDCAYAGPNARNFNSGASYDSSPNNENSYNFCVESLKQCKLTESICEQETPLNYEFYNGWLTGTLYFFLFKYKEKRNNDGELKSIKFCDVDSDNNKSQTYPFKNETEDTVIGDREAWLPAGNNYWFDLHPTPNRTGTGLIKYFPRQPYPILGSNGRVYTRLAYDNIYYAARSIGRPRGYADTPVNDPNLLFATDIINLGSFLNESDPDGAPFFINLIPPTTFQEPEVLSNFLCLSCTKTQPRTGGAYRFEKICEWGAILNDEQETSTTFGPYEIEIDEAYHNGRYFILSANTANNVNDVAIQLMYGNSTGPLYINGQSVRNFVPFGFVASDAGLSTSDEIYVNSSSNYDPRFMSSLDERFTRYQANPYYFYFGLLPGRTAIDLVKTKFITTSECI